MNADTIIEKAEEINDGSPEGNFIEQWLRANKDDIEEYVEEEE